MAQSDSENRSIGRRTFLKGTAATAGAGATVSVAPPRYSPIGRANAIAATTAIGFAAGAVALHYIAEEVSEKFLGDSRDYSGYTGADALHTELVEGALQMKSADERVMTSIENNIANSQNVALAKGKAAIIEEMNAGNGETAANDAMQAAIDSYYSTIQRNVINHYIAQYDQVTHHYTSADNHSNLDASIMQIVHADGISSAFDSMWYQDDSQGNDSKYEVVNYTLLDGTTIDVPVAHYTGDFSEYFSFAPSLDIIEQSGADQNDIDFAGSVQIDKADGSGDTVSYFETQRYRDAFADVLAERDSVNSTLSGFVSDVYSNYSSGDIPTEDLLDPITAATELEQNYDGMQGQGAMAAMLGIPTDAEHSVQLTLVDDAKTVWADIYTNHVPTDADGNEIGFKSGTTYSPSSWSEPFYIAYEYEAVLDEDGNELNETEQEDYDGTTTTEIRSDFVQIEQDFTIEFVEDKDGNEVTEFQTDSRNNQTSDVSALEKELDQIRETQIAMQEEAQAETGGSPGFSWDSISLGGIPGEGVALAVIAVAAYLKGS